MVLIAKSTVNYSSRRVLLKKTVRTLRNAVRNVFEQLANSIFALLP